MPEPTDPAITPTEPSTDAPPAETPDATQPPAPGMGADQDESKWKSLARKHEEHSAKLAKELEQLRKERMSESELAIAEAEARGEAKAMASVRTQLAEAKLRAAAAGKVADVDAIVEFADLSKFVTEDGIDDAAIGAMVDRFAKVAPAQPTAQFAPIPAGPQGGAQRQLTRDDLKSMSPQQIEDARQKGQLDSLLGVTP